LGRELSEKERFRWRIGRNSNSAKSELRHVLVIGESPRNRQNGVERKCVGAKLRSTIKVREMLQGGRKISREKSEE